MENMIARRVRLRLAAVGMTATAADRAAGITIGFTADLLAGRKTQPRPAYLAKLAPVLDCDAEYLMLYQRAPRKGGIPEDGLPLVGICETGVWREPGADIPEAGPTPHEPVPGFPEDHQAVYLVRGKHAEAAGLPSETIIIALQASGFGLATRQPQHGDIAVVAANKGELVETFLARVNLAQDGKPYLRRLDNNVALMGGKIIAIGLAAIRRLA